MVHDLLDDLALLADEEHVVVLGHGDVEAGLLLELLKERLLGFLDLVALSGDADGEGLVLAQVHLDLGVGVLGNLAADAVLLSGTSEDALIELAVTLLLDRDREDLDGRISVGNGISCKTRSTGRKNKARQHPNKKHTSVTVRGLNERAGATFSTLTATGSSGKSSA